MRRSWAVWPALVFCLVAGCSTATPARQASPSPASATKSPAATPTPEPGLTCGAGSAPAASGYTLYCLRFTPGSTVPFGDHQSGTVGVETTFNGTVQFTLPLSWPPPSVVPNSTGKYLFIDLTTSSSLARSCDGIAHHHLQPFGSSPTVRVGRYAGQPGCLITGSQDQAAIWYAQAEALVQLPGVVSLSDNARSLYNSIALEAPRESIEAILASMEIRRGS